MFTAACPVSDSFLTHGGGSVHICSKKKEKGRERGRERRHGSQGVREGGEEGNSKYTLSCKEPGMGVKEVVVGCSAQLVERALSHNALKPWA